MTSPRRRAGASPRKPPTATSKSPRTPPTSPRKTNPGARGKRGWRKLATTAEWLLLAEHARGIEDRDESAALKATQDLVEANQELGDANEALVKANQDLVETNHKLAGDNQSLDADLTTVKETMTRLAHSTTADRILRITDDLVRAVGINHALADEFSEWSPSPTATIMLHLAEDNRRLTHTLVESRAREAEYTDLVSDIELRTSGFIDML